MQSNNTNTEQYPEIIRNLSSYSELWPTVIPSVDSKDSPSVAEACTQLDRSGRAIFIVPRRPATFQVIEIISPVSLLLIISHDRSIIFLWLLLCCTPVRAMRVDPATLHKRKLPMLNPLIRRPIFLRYADPMRNHVGFGNIFSIGNAASFGL